MFEIFGFGSKTGPVSGIEKSCEAAIQNWLNPGSDEEDEQHLEEGIYYTLQITFKQETELYNILSISDKCRKLKDELLISFEQFSEKNAKLDQSDHRS